MLALRVNPGVTHHTYTEAPAPAPAPGTTTLAPRTGRRSSVGPGARQADAAPRRRSSVDASARLAGVKSSGCVWPSLHCVSHHLHNSRRGGGRFGQGARSLARYGGCTQTMGNHD